MPDLAGQDYHDVLLLLHKTLGPETYFEIGTQTGRSLELASCRSICVDPEFVIDRNVIGTKESCHFYQMGSDEFFKHKNIQSILDAPLEMAFLDGMHRCEFLLRDFYNTEKFCRPNSIIALHDCIPVELPMTDRNPPSTPPIAPHRLNWWAGDVWRTVAALMEFRPDLSILCLDAPPTGLVLITNLNPQSSRLEKEYQAVLNYMFSQHLEEITLQKLFVKFNVLSTSVIDSAEKIQSRFWL